MTGEDSINHKNSFQLDEFYLDLQDDGRKITLLTDEELIERPFPGLRSFKTSEYQLFYGREGQADTAGASTDFTNLLLKAAIQKKGNIYVVITMRSEYLGDCIQFRDLPEAINKGQYLVPRLSKTEIKEVIEGPIKLIDKKISPILVNRLISEVGDLWISFQHCSMP